MEDKILQIKCPCCNFNLTINLVSGEIYTDFFNAENYEDLVKELSNLGYELGENEVV